MSNIDLIIEERASVIGNFHVGRLLPFRQKRMVGPFIFIDHMGPARLGEGEILDVGAHPHIGLATLTYLMEGVIVHKDSIGSQIEIEPGAVNLMKAGKGIVHTERSPERLRQVEKTLHGLQIWLALPKEHENDSPQFTHVESSKIPSWKQGDASFRLILGEIGSYKSPVPQYSPSFLLEITAAKTTTVDVGNELFGESGLYIVSGAVQLEGSRFKERQMLVALNSKLCSFTIEEGSTVFIFGGEPFAEERHILWNFVHSSKEQIEKAKQDWINQRFPKVAGEVDFVKMPGTF